MDDRWGMTCTEDCMCACASVYKLLTRLLLATASPALLPRGFKESEAIWALSSFCGTKEEKICLGKTTSARKEGELRCAIGKEGVGCMKRWDEEEGGREDGIACKLSLSSCA